jgi:hypothetical protein
MKEVMKTMLLKKLRVLAGTVMVLAALGAVGFGYQAGGGPGVAQAAPPDKPRNDLDALRRENELLKLNLEVVLEKVRAQEAQLREFRADKVARGAENALYGIAEFHLREWVADAAVPGKATPGENALKEAESALKALREAKDQNSRRNALDALETAVQKLKLQPQPRWEKYELKKK